MTAAQDQNTLGRLEEKVDNMQLTLNDIRDNGSRMAFENKINIRWIWASVCGLSIVFLTGFVYLLDCAEKISEAIK